MRENPISQRAKANFPTVLLTLLSIVQALALELLWGHVSEQDYLYSLSFLAILSWTQISATLIGILLIWLIYSDLVLRLVWVPRTVDAIFPFFVGIFEFAQISALGPSTIGLWFMMLGILFGAMAWISQSSMKQARLDPANQVFFKNVSPATRRDHLMNFAPAVVLLVIGVYLWVSGAQGWIALIAMALTVVLLSYQMWMSHVYTRCSYQLQ